MIWYTKNLQTFAPVVTCSQNLRARNTWSRRHISKILIIKYLEKSLQNLLPQTLISSEIFYQNPNLFLNILNQNYHVSVDLLSSNCQTLSTNSNVNSQTRVWFNVTNKLYNAYLIVFLVVRVQHYERSELFWLHRITVEL